MLAPQCYGMAPNTMRSTAEAFSRLTQVAALRSSQWASRASRNRPG